MKALQVLVCGRRLRVASTLLGAAALVQELESFRVRVSKSGEVFGASANGRYDDLGLAAALAAWGAEMISERTVGLSRLSPEAHYWFQRGDDLPVPPGRCGPPGS